jgi:hypothetical protein
MEITLMIENAKKILSMDKVFNSGNLAVYMLRDCPEVTQVGLDDLAWAYSKDPSTTAKEAESFIQTLEKRLEEIK